MKFEVTDEHLKNLKKYLDDETQNGHDYRNKLTMYVANRYRTQQIALLLSDKGLTNKRLRSSLWQLVRKVGVRNRSELEEVCRKYYKMK